MNISSVSKKTLILSVMPMALIQHLILERMDNLMASSNENHPRHLYGLKPGSLIDFTFDSSPPPGQNGQHFAKTSSNAFSRTKVRISLKFVPEGLISHNPMLVPVMAWHRTGAKLLPEPMLTQFTDKYIRHKGRWVNYLISTRPQLHWGTGSTGDRKWVDSRRYSWPNYDLPGEE